MEEPVSWLVALLKAEEALARSDDREPVPIADCADERRLAPSERIEESWALTPRARTTGARITEVRILGGGGGGEEEDWDE